MKNQQLTIPTENVQVFQFHNQAIRTEIMNSEPWFCLKDVCVILGIKQPADLKRRLNPHGVGYNHIIDIKGRKQKAIFINESNLYKAIFKSEKPEALEFEDYVTGEVLPAIRKTGSYSVNQQPQLDTPSTKEDRKPLTNLVSTLVDCAPFSFRNAWHMVHAHMGGKHAEEFTLAELPIALAFVQEQINLHTAKPAYADYPDAQLGLITELAMQGARRFSIYISLGDKKTRNTNLITKSFKADIYLFEENAIEPKGLNYSVKFIR